MLFGQNFGDVIKPAEGVIVCPQWNPVPTGKGHLTAAIRSLQYLSWKKDGPENSLTSSKLMDKAYWHLPSNILFVDCKHCLEATGRGSRRCSKSPQEVVTEPEKRKEHREVPPEEGAVVFGGRQRTPRKPHIPQTVTNGEEDNRKHLLKGKLSKIRRQITSVGSSPNPN